LNPNDAAIAIYHNVEEKNNYPHENIYLLLPVVADLISLQAEKPFQVDH
jgi:hypothetical protein